MILLFFEIIYNFYNIHYSLNFVFLILIVPAEIYITLLRIFYSYKIE